MPVTVNTGWFQILTNKIKNHIPGWLGEVLDWALLLFGVEQVINRIVEDKFPHATVAGTGSPKKEQYETVLRDFEVTDPGEARNIRMIVAKLDHHRSSDFIVSIVRGFTVLPDGSINKLASEYKVALHLLDQVAKSTDPFKEAVALGLIKDKGDLYPTEKFWSEVVRVFSAIGFVLKELWHDVCEVFSHLWKICTNFAGHASNATSGDWSHKGKTAWEALKTLRDDVANLFIKLFIPFAKVVAIVIALILVLLAIAFGLLAFCFVTGLIPMWAVANNAANGSPWRTLGWAAAALFGLSFLRLTAKIFGAKKISGALNGARWFLFAAFGVASVGRFFGTGATSEYAMLTLLVCTMLYFAMSEPQPAQTSPPPTPPSTPTTPPTAPTPAAPTVATAPHWLARYALFAIAGAALFQGTFPRATDSLIGFMHNGSEGAQDGLDYVRENSATSDARTYRVNGDAQALMCRKGDIDPATGQLVLGDAFMGDFAPVPSGDLVIAAFKRTERGSKWQSTQYRGATYIAVQLQDKRGLEGTFSNQENDPVYLVPEGKLGRPGSTAKIVSLPPAPAPAAPKPAAAAATAQPAAPAVNASIASTGEPSLPFPYDANIWNNGQTMISQVFAELGVPGQPGIWLLYLSNQDGNPVELAIPAGQTFRVCEPKQFATARPATQIELAGHSLPNSWTDMASQNDAQCSWAWNFKNDWPTTVKLRIGHTGGGSNQLLLVSDQDAWRSTKQNISTFAGWR